MSVIKGSLSFSAGSSIRVFMSHLLQNMIEQYQMETLFTDENVPRQGDSINLPDNVELVIDSSSNFTDNINYFDEINIPESSKFTLDLPGKTFAFKKINVTELYTSKAEKWLLLKQMEWNLQMLQMGKWKVPDI